MSPYASNVHSCVRGNNSCGLEQHSPYVRDAVCRNNNFGEERSCKGSIRDECQEVVFSKVGCHNTARRVQSHHKE